MKTRVALGIVALLVATAALIGAPRSAAGGHHASVRKKVEILAPRDRSRPKSAKVRVRVRVRTRGRKFRIFLNGRPVASEFHGKRIRRATLDRRSGLRIGENSLLARVGKKRVPDTDQSYFILRKRNDRLLKVKLKQKGRFQLPRIHVRTRGRLRDSKMWLNGRRVDRQFDVDDDQRGFSGRVRGDSRLRFGSNRITVLALQRNGRFARRTVRFRISRARAIASAGPDRRVSVGDAIRLDAGESRHANRRRHRRRGVSGRSSGRSLRYRWKLLSAPPGSKAKLTHRHSVKPKLAPDRPGTYRARVIVTNRRGRKSADEVDVDAPQSVGPMGMPVQTITKDGGIQIGDPDQQGEQTFPRLGGWVQMVVLDPDTAAPMAGQWDSHSGVKEPRPGVLGFNPGQGDRLLAAVQQTKSQQLVLLSGQGEKVDMSGSDASDLTKAIEFLGGTVAYYGTTPHGASDLVDGQWSLFGHQGLTEGQAYQNAFAREDGIPGFLGGDPGSPGSLNGYLQSGMNSIGFQYVSPETVPIDTKWTQKLSQPPSPTRNTIKVGDQKYASAPIDGTNVPGCPCSVAVQMEVLNPGDLSWQDGGTFGVLTDNGSTDYGGIYYLDQMLHRYVSQHGGGDSHLIIVQDFGKQGCACWPDNSPDWLEDTIPSTSYTPWWKGNSYPNSTGELINSWNKANAHGFGSVAGNLGKLAGIPVHDLVANYRRPVYVPDQGRTVPRTWGGLTVISATNLFQWSSAFAQGQGDIPPKSNDPLLDDGRVTGVLRRNQQSQWQMSGGGLGAGYPGLVKGTDPDSSPNSFDAAALPELVLGPQNPWPCSARHPAPCPDDPGKIRAAMLYFSQELPSLGGVDDIRDDYLNDNISWASQAGNISRLGCSGVKGVDPTTCRTLRRQLEQEFGDLDQVEKGFGNLMDLTAKDSRDSEFDIKEASSKVTSAISKAKHDLLKRRATVDFSGPLDDAILVASGILDAALEAEVAPEELAVGPGALAAVSALMELGDDVFPFFDQSEPASEQKVDNDTAAVRDQVHNLGNDLRIRMEGIEGTLKHFEDITRTDPVKLHQAADNFGLEWALTTKNEQRMGQSITIGADRSLYESLMPIAFTQWVLSPRHTDINGNGAADLPDRGYNCRNLDGDGWIDGYDNPLVNEPKSMSGMTSVDFTSDAWSNREGYTVRFLKARDADVSIQSAQHDAERGDNYVEHKGDSPSPSLTDPLFEQPSDLVDPTTPVALGMSKDEFFGLPGWSMRKLQCGWAR